MATVYKNTQTKNSYWVDLRAELGIRAFTKPSRKEAIAERNRLLALHETGVDLARRNDTFGKLLDDWYASKHRSVSCSPDYIASFNVGIELLKKCKINGIPLMEWRLKDLNTGILKEHVQNLLHEGVEPKTGNNRWHIVTGCFKYAVECQRLAADPTATIKPKPEPDKKIRRLDPDDVKAAIAAMPKFHLEARVAAQTGIRTGELRALAWGCIKIGNRSKIRIMRSLDKKGRFISAKTFAGQGREIQIGADLANALRAHQENQTEEERKNGLAFPDEKGAIVKPDVWRLQGIHKGCRAAGVEKISWHDLRHFYASTLIFQTNLPPSTVCYFMGHTNISFTYKQYGHWLANRSIENEMGEVLESAFSGMF